MSTPIYTDKDYLDSQFGVIQLALAGLDKKMVEAEARTMARIDSHDRWHNRWGKRILSAIIAVATGGYIAWPK